MADKLQVRLQPSTDFDALETPSNTQRPAPPSSPFAAPHLPPSTPTKLLFVNETNSIANMSQTANSGSMARGSKILEIRNLMSPPETAPLETFTQANSSTAMSKPISPDRPMGTPPTAPISPPISPYEKPTVNVGDQSVVVQDPILYPTQDPASSPPERPLFDEEESVNQLSIDKHVAARSPNMFREASPPRREDYHLVLHFRSQVMKKFSENPNQWLLKEKAQLLADRQARIRHRAKYHPLLPASRPLTVRQLVSRPIRPDRLDRVNRNSPSPRSIRANPAPAMKHTIRVSGTPDRERRKEAPNREDKDFQSLPDYSPPLTSLPNKPNSLKVDWKGQPVDLSDDPHRHLLHPDEISLASNLRLDCATYLTSKRRMFIRRIECAEKGKEFRKTDAQQACKIDVNKASKLWMAFEKVGWLNIDWVRQFIGKTSI